MANCSRFFIAALAAMLVSILTACGGGEDMVLQDQAARQAFTGQAVTNAQALDLKKYALAVPLAVSQYGTAVFTATSLTQQRVALAATDQVSTGVTPDELMDWAEQVYPQLFPSHRATSSITLDADGDGQQETIAYRYWPETGNYAGVQIAGKDVGGIYLYGTYVGNVLTRYAHIEATTIRCTVKPDLCRPVVTSVTPVDGATGVEIKNVAIMVRFDRQVICPIAPVTGTFGVIAGTLTCANTQSVGTVTITATSLPDNSRISATLSGFRSVEGAVAMNDFSWSFTTRKGVVTVVESKVLTVNLNGHTSRESVSIIDPITNSVVSKVVPPPVPGFGQPFRMFVDSVRGVGYIGEQFGFVIHRFNPRTGENLSSFPIEDAGFAQGHGIQGMDGTGNEVCTVTGRTDYHTQYLWRNRLVCYNSDGVRTFTSATDFLGDVTEFPTRLRYLGGKYYVLMVAYNCAFVDQEVGNGRDGYCAGSVGHLVEIDGTTKVRQRTWSVGSMPFDLALTGNSLRVLKSGDRGVTVVDLFKQPSESGATRSVDWSAQFSGRAYPVAIVTDEANGVYYVSDWLNAVHVMSLSTDQEISRIAMPSGGVPRDMVIASGDLWVAIPLRDTFYTDAQRVVRIDRVTRSVKQTISLGPVPDSRIGLVPMGLAVYEVTEVR